MKLALLIVVLLGAFAGGLIRLSMNDQEAWDTVKTVQEKLSDLEGQNKRLKEELQIALTERPLLLQSEYIFGLSIPGSMQQKEFERHALNWITVLKKDAERITKDYQLKDKRLDDDEITMTDEEFDRLAAEVDSLEVASEMAEGRYESALSAAKELLIKIPKQ